MIELDHATDIFKYSSNDIRSTAFKNHNGKEKI